jgi:DNA-binding response OmpR family regulator
MGPLAEAAEEVVGQPQIPRRCARILVIEDEEDGRNLMCRQLRHMGHEATSAADGFEGLGMIRDLRPDLLILDLNVPKINGIRILQAVSRHPHTKDMPVLCVTGEADPEGLLRDSVLGFAAYACLRKPIGFDQLREQVAKGLALKQLSGTSASKTIRRGEVVADESRRCVWISGRQLELLGHRQFPLLWALMRREGPVTIQELLLEVWNGDEGPKTVVMAVKRLRDTLEGADAPCRIETVGHGYQFIALEEQACEKP